METAELTTDDKGGIGFSNEGNGEMLRRMSTRRSNFSSLGIRLLYSLLALHTSSVLHIFSHMEKWWKWYILCAASPLPIPRMGLAQDCMLPDNIIICLILSVQ